MNLRRRGGQIFPNIWRTGAVLACTCSNYSNTASRSASEQLVSLLETSQG